MSSTIDATPSTDLVRVAVVDDHESVRLGLRAAIQAQGFTITDNVKNIQATGAAVLVHSIADRAAGVREALAAGAAGVIPKSAATSTVMAAIRTVARGEVLNNLEWASAIDADVEFAKAQLGRRERDVLNLYASGLPLRMV